MNDRTMTSDELTALALPLSTQHFLHHIIRVLHEDGLISKQQIRRAADGAMKDLQSKPGLVQIRAALLLEPLLSEN